ncbi:hypothetical protein [Spirosoma pulveris]
MKEFSLNNALERILNKRTRVYFQEIKNSYENGNYRVSTVGLFSVVLCDIIYKLQDLKDKYGDTNAIQVLEEVERQQNHNIHSSSWEEKLIENAYKKVKLIDVQTYTNILNLQKHRHLCAHPVMDGDFNLFQPNQETTISHIRNMAEGLFSKPILASNSVFEMMLLDIEENENFLIKNEDIFNYINDRYLKNTNVEVRKYIFKNLWKFTYRLDNERCNKNRSINHRTLRVIYNNEPDVFNDFIKSEVDYFSNISSGESILYLMAFIGYNPHIYFLLNDSAKLVYNGVIKNDLNKQSMAWFLADNLGTHIRWIINNTKNLDDFDSRYAHILEKPYFEAGMQRDLFDCFISLYCSSIEKRFAENRFFIIQKYINQFSQEQCIALLGGIEKSPLLTIRVFKFYNKKITDNVILKFKDAFDFKNYPKIANSIK